eukprot:6483814-Amphidinium_carterae.1
MWLDVTANALSRANWRESLVPYTLSIGLSTELCKRGGGRTHVTDAKALFDSLQKEASASHQDRRAAVDLSIIQESITRAGAHLKWVPH